MLLRYLQRSGLRAVSAPCKMAPGNPPRIPAKGRTFSVQYNLPKLPVPPLEQTLNKYLDTLKPILTDDQMKNTKEIVDSFKVKEGPKLQALLEEKAKDPECVNWLSEWWKNLAYLEPRIPVVVNVSPGVYFPRHTYRGEKEMLGFASKFIAGVLDYKSMLDAQTLPVDTLGGKPLCMAQYYQILNACRVPGVKKDSHVCVSPMDTNQPRHINVIHNNHIFSVDVIGPKGKALSPAQICQQLEIVVNQSKSKADPVGMLTSMDRGSWGYVYSRMVKDITNRASFINLQRSIFIVCLDGAYESDGKRSGRDIACAAMLHGLGSQGYAGNRWFDKTLQFIFNPDGYYGLTYEHTSAEGPPIVGISDYALAYCDKEIPSNEKFQEVDPPTKLKFNYKEKTKAVMQKGGEEIDSTVDDLMLRSLWFTDFGKRFIKSQKLSPDAFIQVAFQLAYYNMYKQPCATYESGSLRMFQLGRTDTIRSCSSASLAFCKAMNDKSVPDSKRVELLKQAVTAHRKYTSAAISGQGIDRHLLGLKMTALENGMDIPQLFMDLSFRENLHFCLSTSQVASKYEMVLNFGPVVPDGYGICYNPQEDSLCLAISSFNNSPDTNSDDFIKSLTNAFLHMQRILTQAKL